MIKANELRIGNWVMCKNYHGMEYYTQVGSVGNSGIDGGCTHDGDIEWDECWPMPLTPEILEKCRFERWEPQPGIVQFRLNEGDLIGEVDMKGGWAFNPGIDGYWIEKQCLHELQNLYFALTGEELIYTP